MRRTAEYPRAWLAHHRLQWGENWVRVKHLFTPKRKETPMS